MREQRVIAQIGVAPDAAGAAYVSRYLKVTRQYRVAGCIAVVIVHGARASHASGFSLSIAEVLCGWLVGAILAELSLGQGARGPRPTRNAVPLWLLTVPAVLGAAAFGVALRVLSLAFHPTQTLYRYAWEGLAVCAATAAAGLYVLRRHGISDVDDDTDLALRARSVAAMTAVAMAIVMLLPMNAAEDAGAATTRPIRGLIGGLGLMWALGALAIGLVITRSGRWGALVGRPSRLLIVSAAVLLVSSAAWIGAAAARLHPPYGPNAVRPTATIRITDEQHYQADAAALGVRNIPPQLFDGDPHRLFVGRVDVIRPENAPSDAKYDFVFIDRRTNTAIGVLSDETGSSGWDSYLGELTQRYPWLSALTPKQVDGAYEMQGAAISLSASNSGPEVFSGLVENDSTLTAQDLEVVMIFVGPDGQVYWAAQVPVTT